ncbi:spectrin beta chain, non-erythrocytic 1 isoform X6 [Danio aesculapii]|uniref:spectrin beta chain, non-erythrocytic 1 isoform X6 n=1 Tax=Danio aesculapii TaxID=1142201 RepID=UPI0024BFC120|nr:spectrin beta chain, non-erythrocytic 1 isoform X6 [Danio aesculapii]
MSESIVRKIQPFTIRTKLSAPAVTPKCSDFHDDYLPNRTFSDSCKLRHLNEQVCLYLNQHEDECCVSPNAASRSIRKITISSQIDTLTAGMEMKNINNNNNNSKTSNTQLPKIVGVSCENKPNTHFKVLLCKDGEKQCSADREKYSSSPQRLDGSSCEDKDTCLSAKVSSVQNEHSFAEQKALFNKEISQAEMWIRAKLRDLRDGNNIQKSPVTDWEEACQTLQRDLKDFENTVIQLNQMGEQLMCKLNPTSDLVKKQLAQIRDQWNALKLTAANQMKAMGGAKNLQEFNRKVERLEAWIKEKQEQEQSLANILGENIDKMQITRKILDLKQDEQLYRNLHEEINQMALRLEKQGKTEGKSISAHRKHINKIWLKAQSHLKEHHENLQLALEVSSFYQQAENIICSIISMNKSPSSGVENSRDGEIRDIASQIMMLDVSVSQLSNLQPALAARVTQKQSELKDCWAAFQKTLRNEKAAQLPSLTREGSDPETPSQEPPGSVGTDPHRIMGKEVKEEQNRLKGFTVVRDVESSRKPSDSGDAAHSCVSDIPVNLQTESESSGHPPLHIQLQKFTVSADKTLSWLKESVAMATQICSLSGPNGFDAAKRRQASLQQEILSNKARIELVKKEGHSLVKAQHPGSLKIQEFLSQLEVLWDELKRRHQRNGLVLKLSEELNCRVVRMLQALGSLEAWLEAVELSIRQASLSGDPESVSVAEQESRELEQELETRRLELRDLRLEVDHLSRQKHLQTQLLPARLMEVEKKFSSVQTALTQQSSELKDTRMLTEFLEKLELEENHYSTLGKPLCSDLDSGASLLGRRHDDRLMEAIGNPVKELREAVEMLNDTARERGRTQTHDHSIQQLINTHAMVSARVEQCLRRCAELAVDVLEMESEMAVKCEPDRCGLDDLQEYQDQLEAEYGLLKQEVELMKSLWIRLSDVCPERMTSVSSEIQSSLDSWMELSKSLSENKKRLLQFTHLRHFFRRYLDMISWTEDTRSCIFSESALRQSRQNQEPLVEVLDRQIQHKFEEFDRLALAGQKLFDHQHHLSKMIRERMEELRSMLGWILVHWRAQKDQLLNRQKTEDEQRQEDAIYSEAAVCSSLTQKEILPAACRQKTEMLPVSPPADLEDALQFSNDEYEVMKSVSPVGGECRNHSERAESPYLLLKESSPSSLGGTVNLILSFSEAGDTQIQLQSSGGENDMPEPEPMHRDQSMSLLSLHMGLDDSDMQSGRQELELPSMEGTLERKHKLQLGGKKAPCRAWSSYHAVLYKHTICFYQDRKDTLKSCVTSLPLNLIGAVCEPSPEYTKKPNCFYLRLRDGSEYLLSASSRFMMKKWILRIQAHTASGGCVSARHGSSATLSRYSPAISCCQCADKCLCSMRNYVSTTVLAQSQQNSGRTKEIIVHTTDRHQDLSFNSCSNAGHCDDDFESVRQNMSSVSTTQDWTSEKRRSHSFTSATYQRIKPVAPPPGRVENSSSSYSVTLFIGERETSPVICKNRKESCSDLPITSYSSLPRHRNKSVFRKFFGMKE